MSIRVLARSLLTVAAIAATAVVVSPASAGPAPGVVRVESGWLRGSVAADHVTYSAIPYATPPVADRRWRPPVRPKPWSGARDATTPSTPCPQFGMDGITGAEDCLQLDVTVPRNVRPGERLPVLVWLHGGGFVNGSAQEYDGTRLATSGRLMVVTVNYRLGALGFLSAPALDTGGGNYGLMDQAAALRWIHRNANQFGGDPRNVTLAGQSAGARGVCAQLASPGSRGLFHRAIAQSGACETPVPSLAAAQKFGAQATETLGCTTDPDPAACLRGKTQDELLTKLPGARMPVNSRNNERFWGPVAGTRVLPRQPGDALRDGSAARVPLLIGGTHDEMRAFVSNQAALTVAEYHTMMVEAFGPKADVVLAKYPVTDYDSPALALATVLTDWGGFIGACPALRTAQDAAAHQPVYAYEFTEDSLQHTDDFPMGSYHGLDLPYLWHLKSTWNPYPDLTAEQEQLSATIIGYWSAFARTGDPNGQERPHWPEFGSADTVIELSADGIAPTPFAEDHRCGFWAGLPR